MLFNNTVLQSMQLPSTDSFVPLLRDGIDVYLGDDEDLVFVFLTTRKRVKVACLPCLVRIIPRLNGNTSLGDLLVGLDPDTQNKAISFLAYLREKGIVVNGSWLDDLELPSPYKKKLERFATFLLDTVGSEYEASEALHRIHAAKIALVGVGSVGSWMVRTLNMVGFRRFILIDGKLATNAVREVFPSSSGESQSKAEQVAILLREIDPHVEVSFRRQTIRPDLEEQFSLDGVDLLINAADEPYVGYVNTLLCRIALHKGIPFFAAGGFDAHLGCHGELTIPGQTPCTDCYTRFFQRSLTDWKPVDHPVSDRRLGFGGLPSLSAYAAAQGVMTILRHFLNLSEEPGGRAEFLFRNNTTDRFRVERDPDCPTCANISQPTLRRVASLKTTQVLANA